MGVSMLLVGLRGCESLLALLLALLSSKGRPTELQHAFNCQVLFETSAKDQKLKASVYSCVSCNQQQAAEYVNSEQRI